MRTFIAFAVGIAIGAAPVIAQEKIFRMDDEPHYSRVFSNEFCRAYLVELGRLAETKPVAHEHDWVRMTLGGAAEEAWGGTLYSTKEDPDGYLIAFLFPVKRLSLRNPHNDSYRSMVVEIMKSDEALNRIADPSLSHFSQVVGPGVDPNISYVNSLTRTSVNILNVQLIGGDSKDLSTPGYGALLVAITDANLSYQTKEGKTKELHLSNGDFQWFDGAPPI